MKVFESTWGWVVIEHETIGGVIRWWRMSQAYGRCGVHLASNLDNMNPRIKNWILT